MERPRAGDDALGVAVDLVFGAVLPVCALVFDPIVFSAFGGEAWDGILFEYRHAAWSGLGLLIALLVWWRLARPYRTLVPALLSGVFAVGGLVALAFGISLLPAVLAVIRFPLYAVLALVPIPTAVVYAANARRAYTVASDRIGTAARTFATLGAAGTVLLACGLIWLS